MGHNTDNTEKYEKAVKAWKVQESTGK